jgi:hypothetical protein
MKEKAMFLPTRPDGTVDLITLGRVGQKELTGQPLSARERNMLDEARAHPQGAGISTQLRGGPAAGADTRLVAMTATAWTKYSSRAAGARPREPCRWLRCRRGRRPRQPAPVVLEALLCIEEAVAQTISTAAVMSPINTAEATGSGGGGD